MTKINNITNKNKKPKSKLRNKICPICKLNDKKYSSSSLGRHIRTVHGNKWECSYCHTLYADKNSHKLCFQKEKFLLLNFIEGFNKSVVENDKKNFIHLNSIFLLFLNKKMMFIILKNYFWDLDIFPMFILVSIVD